MDLQALVQKSGMDADGVPAVADVRLLQPSAFPVGAEAVIYQPAKSAMTSGTGRTRQWVLEFKPRSPDYIEPLMGWVGSTDPLRQVQLGFPSKEAAIRYATRQGLRFSVREPHKARGVPRSYAENFVGAKADPIPRFLRDGRDLVPARIRASQDDPASGIERTRVALPMLCSGQENRAIAAGPHHLIRHAKEAA